MNEPGQIAYEAWRQAMQEGINPDFHTLPLWENLKPERKDGWARVEKAVLDAQSCQHPFESVDWSVKSLKSWERIYKCAKCGKEL